MHMAYLLRYVKDVDVKPSYVEPDQMNQWIWSLLNMALSPRGSSVTISTDINVEVY